MEENKNNIIIFPKQNKMPQHQFDTTEELQNAISSNIIDMKLDHINEALYMILPKLFQNIDMTGGSLPDTNEDLSDEYKDINLIVESVKSLLYKRYHIDHPFQQLSEKLFVVTDDGNININEKLEIVFNIKKDE